MQCLKVLRKWTVGLTANNPIHLATTCHFFYSYLFLIPTYVNEDQQVLIQMFKNYMF